MKRSARISDCQRYRMELIREREPATGRLGTVTFLLNNPSTADALVDDPTVRRGVGYMETWEFNRLRFLNTNPARATKPSNAWMPPEHVLALNDQYIRIAAADSAMIVLAWGDKVNPQLARRAYNVLRDEGVAVWVLGLTNGGIPRHPLYLKKDLLPTPWRWKP